MFPVRKLCILLSILVPFFIVSACATEDLRSEYTRSSDRKSFEETEERDRIIAYAESLLGETRLESLGREFRSDCSGYVVGVFSSLGYRVVIEPSPNDNSVSQALFYTLQRRRLVYSDRKPQNGDLVFFKGTTEKRRYRISHVGLVTGVGADGTVEIVHYTNSHGVQTLRMNLRTPGEHRDLEGRVVNDFIKKGPGDRLSGQLFYAYGNLFRYLSDRRL